MSVLQYPKTQYYIVLNTATQELGNFTGASGDLNLANIRVFNVKTGAYSYQLRLVFHYGQTGTEFFSTDWETFSNTVTGQTTAYWMGDLCFDVGNVRLNSAVKTYVRLETSGYTRNNNDTYLGVWCDWMEPIGNTSTGAARMTLGVLNP